jgi:hypothetical protein
MLLVTLQGQAITHKLQFQGHMGEQNQELLKNRRIGLGPAMCPSPHPVPSLQSWTHPKHHDKVKLLPSFHHMDFQRLLVLNIELRDWCETGLLRIWFLLLPTFPSIPRPPSCLALLTGLGNQVGDDVVHCQWVSEKHSQGRVEAEASPCVVILPRAWRE